MKLLKIVKLMLAIVFSCLAVQKKEIEKILSSARNKIAEELK